MSAAYERVLDALHAVGMKVKPSNSGTTARAQCPSHGSRGLTLSIRCAEDRALVKCWAGCEIDQVLDAMELAVKDLFDDDPAPGYRPPPRPKPGPFDTLTRPGLEHVLNRMVTEQKLEADPGLRTRARAEWAEQVVIR